MPIINNSEVDLRGCLRAIKAQFQPTLDANDLDWNIKTNSTSITWYPLKSKRYRKQTRRMASENSVP